MEEGGGTSYFLTWLDASCSRSVIRICFLK